MSNDSIKTSRWAGASKPAPGSSDSEYLSWPEAERPSIQITLKQTNAFRHLWIKYVTAFDIRFHCARSLIGKYSKLLPYRGRLHVGEVLARVLDESPAKYIYVCGTTGTWSANVHLALRPRRGGGEVLFEDERARFKCCNVDLMSICTPTDLPLPKAFTTCRNFNFGYEYLGGRAQWEALRQPINE